MAGIGFRLNKLLNSGSYTSALQAYGYAALLSCGPWLVTVAVIGLVSVMAPSFLGDPDDLVLFRVLITHIYAVTLITSGIYQMVASRHIADRLWLKDVEALVPDFVTLLVLSALAYSIIGGVASTYIGLEPALALAVVALTVVVGCLWLAITFLSAAKDYERISFAFIVGAGVSVAGAVYGGRFAGLPGCMYGFMAGQLTTLVLLVSRVFAEFRASRALNREVLHAFSRYWDLALTGVLFNLGIWIDKFVFAWSDVGSTIAPGLRTEPVYEGAIFVAYLTITPALAVFLVQIETAFYVCYRGFFSAISNRATLAEIQIRKHQIGNQLQLSIGRLLRIQGLATLLTIILAEPITWALGFRPEQIPLLRVGALAAFLQVMLQLVVIGLLYMEKRAEALSVSFLFCAGNWLFTSWTIAAGLEWFGYGYAAACFLALLVAYVLFENSVVHLERDTFLRQPVTPPQLAEPVLHQHDDRPHIYDS